MIRKATLADLERIFEIESMCFLDDAQSKRSLKYLILANSAHFFVFEKSKKIIATMILFTRINSKRLRIYSLAVDQTYQGQGIGKKFLFYAKNYAINFNYPLLTLEVKETNIGAIGLYQVFGFKKVGIKQGYYHQGEAAICMECLIKK